MSLEFLSDYDFIHSGTCCLSDDGRLIITINTHREKTDLLYAFVSGQQVKYIGYTSKTFENRMYGYTRPGAGQSTNIGVNQKVSNLLQNMEEVNLYTFCPGNLLQYRGLPINLAAGLEKSLISRIAEHHRDNNLEPLWNIHGNPFLPFEPTPPQEAVAILNEDLEENLTYVPNEEVMIPEGYPVRLDLSLSIAYLTMGFINIAVGPSEFLGAHGDGVTVAINGANPPIVLQKTINRTINRNGSPRIQLGPAYTQWVSQNYQMGDLLPVTILSPDHIQLA